MEDIHASEPITLPIIPASDRKRKRDEIADSQSEEEDRGSDEEFGWIGEDPFETPDLIEDPEPTQT